MLTDPVIRFVAAVLIGYLLTLFLVYTDGPPIPRTGPLFLALRKAAGFRPGAWVDGEWMPLADLRSTFAGHLDESEIEYRPGGRFTALLLACHRCTGFWVGMVVGLLLFGLSLEGIVLALAATGGAIYLHER